MVSDRTSKLKLGEKIGYGLGDAGSNFYWAIIGSWLLFFYTEIYGLEAGAVATMLAVTKILDAFTDPIIGALSDRTTTRWGKYRPYIFLGAIPLAVAGILALSTPDVDDPWKLIWAYGTYSFMMLAYTIVNLPYSSLAGVITADTTERNSLFSIRFFFAYFTGIIVGAATPDLAAYFGQDDPARGWQITMAIYAAIATLLFWITVASTKERIAPRKDQQTNVKQDILDLLSNKAWIILFILAMVIMITITLRASSSGYYFKYFVERQDLMGVYVGLQMAALATGALLCPFLLRLVGDKARLLGILMAIVGVLSFVFVFIPKPDTSGTFYTATAGEFTISAEELLKTQHFKNSTYTWTIQSPGYWIFKKSRDVESDQNEMTFALKEKDAVTVTRHHVDANGNTQSLSSQKIPIEIMLMFLLNLLISLALGPKAPLTWSMLADAADYNEWKFGRRATGMTFSAATFSQKLGGALGAFLIGKMLAHFSYVANQEQSSESQFAIVLLQTVVPGVFALLSVFVIRKYDLTSAKLEQIQEDLKAREAAQ